MNKKIKAKRSATLKRLFTSLSNQIRRPPKQQTNEYTRTQWINGIYTDNEEISETFSITPGIGATASPSPPAARFAVMNLGTGKLKHELMNDQSIQHYYFYKYIIIFICYHWHLLFGIRYCHCHLS